MPESIGSRNRVLLVGTVCDRCNNYFSIKIEQPVLAHAWMRNIRAWEQVPSKKGRFPSMVGRIAGTNIPINMRLGRDGNLEFEAERKSDTAALREAIAGGLESPLLFAMEDGPMPAEMSRFLCKMALETVAELFCRSPAHMDLFIDEPYFDNIREFARYGTKFEEWPFSRRRVFPHDTLMRHPETGEWVQAGFGCGLFMNKRRETLFAFCFYGVEFVVNVGGPSIAGYEEWLADHNGISPLVERLGCHMVTEGEGESRKHYLHGSFEPRNGLDFDRAHGYAPGPR